MVSTPLLWTEQVHMSRVRSPGQEKMELKNKRASERFILTHWVLERG